MPPTPTTDPARIDAPELFAQRWTVAPSAFGRWGRGPTGNASACIDCHAAPGAPPLPAEVRLARRTLHLAAAPRAGVDAPQPHPRYGAQLQTEGIAGVVPAEGALQLTWRTATRRLPDGTRVAMRAPRVQLSALAFGAIEPDAARSLRIAPSLDAVAALSALDTAAIDRPARGRAPRRVAADGDASTPRVGRVGRFGWKASHATLHAQIATAWAEDLGVTSPMRPDPQCPPVQRACAAQPPGLQPETTAAELDALAAWLAGAHIASPDAPTGAATTSLAGPAGADPAGRVGDLAVAADAAANAATASTANAASFAPGLARGAALFRVSGCADCHAANVGLRDRTAPDAWSDARLHDLGRGLADGFPDGAAGPRDWRTAPLVGLGAKRAVAGAGGDLALLHDGRARGVVDAVLWHDGEARASRRAFERLPRGARAALVAWVESR
ncbi:MAG: hypothetical protein MUF30_08260 [Burkholderiales bacterium]|nr:hypothetical protein [Burkholderiales bacterium]